MQVLVRTSDFVLTLHGHEEMEADGLTVCDLVHVILTGRIVARQRDERSSEWKYLVQGESLEGDDMIVVSKLGLTGKLVVLTMYLL